MELLAPRNNSDIKLRRQLLSSNRHIVTFSIALLFILFSASAATAHERTIGINYGRVADNLPSPDQVVSLIRNLNIGKVKIYDANPQVLQALANTGLEVVIMVTNQQVHAIGSSQATAENWVLKNVVPWYDQVYITTVAVGNEILSDTTIRSTWFKLVPAMENIHVALKRHNLGDVKVTTPVAIDCLETSYPPSMGTFRADIAARVMTPMLHFLHRTKSPFFINVYPYFAWAASPQQISLHYALFGSKMVVVEDSSLEYSNLLEAQLDALVAAMGRAGYRKVKVTISETGWPSKGDANQTGATISNAFLYNNRLTAWSLQARGTPLRRGEVIPTFIFALFNEDQKPGPETERNWGILYPNGTPVYSLDTTGEFDK